MRIRSLRSNILNSTKKNKRQKTNLEYDDELSLTNSVKNQKKKVKKINNLEKSDESSSDIDRNDDFKNDEQYDESSNEYENQAKNNNKNANIGSNSSDYDERDGSEDQEQLNQWIADAGMLKSTMNVKKFKKRDSSKNQENHVSKSNEWNVDKLSSNSTLDDIGFKISKKSVTLIKKPISKIKETSDKNRYDLDELSSIASGSISDPKDLSVKCVSMKDEESLSKKVHKRIKYVELSSYKSPESNENNELAICEPAKAALYLLNLDRIESSSNPLVQTIYQLAQNQQKMQNEFAKQNENRNETNNRHAKVKLHSKSSLYVTNYRLNCAIKAKTVSVFARRIFTAPLNVIDIYRTNVTGASSKRSDRQTISKKQLDPTLKNEIYSAAVEHVPKLCIDNYKKEIDQAIVSKLGPLNNLFEAMKNGEMVNDDLLKKCKIIRDDLTDFGDFNQYDKDRTMFDGLDKDYFEDLNDLED